MAKWEKKAKSAEEYVPHTLSAAEQKYADENGTFIAHRDANGNIVAIPVIVYPKATSKGVTAAAIAKGRITPGIGWADKGEVVIYDLADLDALIKALQIIRAEVGKPCAVPVNGQAKAKPNGQPRVVQTFAQAMTMVG